MTKITLSIESTSCFPVFPDYVKLLEIKNLFPILDV